MANIQYTDFIRTSEKRHEQAVHHFWVIVFVLSLLCFILSLT